MKVGFISVVWMPFGGTETWHRTLLPHIEELSHFCIYGRMEGDLDWLDPTVTRLRGHTGAIKVFKECDVVVIWGITNIEELVTAAGRRPTIIGVHHGDPSSTWAKNCTNNIIHKINRLVAVHPEVARIYEGEWIPNGIDPNRIKPTSSPEELRSKWGIGNKKICLWMARYSSEKNPFAAQRIATHLPDDWCMIMAGTPQPGFRQIGTAIHVGQCHPGNWLQMASCFLSTSDQEGFGLSIGEAMLARVPVVGTPVGLCAYPHVCKTINLRTGRDTVAKLITTPPPEEQLNAAYQLASGFSISSQAIEWNNLIKETHTLTIIQ